MRDNSGQSRGRWHGRAVVRRLVVVILSSTAVAGLPSLCGCAGSVTRVPEDAKYLIRVDDDTGWKIHELRVGVGGDRELSVKIVPDAGANAFSLRVNDTELLRSPPSIRELPGFGYGIPILYPTPNRVRGATFEFEGREFRLRKNSGDNHIHGLVHDLPWEAGDLEVEDGALSLPVVLDVVEGHPLYSEFPFDHRLEITYTLRKDGLVIDLEIKNRDTRRLPFGFGLHPYFRILGEREQTYITAPARRHMEAGRFDKLPTGTLRDLDGSDRDLRSPVSLGALNLDDVYWGMDPDRPAVSEARDAGVLVRLHASEIFTHLVVYTPPTRDFYCLENQTCSTDAHNLYAKDHAEAAHLLILEPIGSPGSTVEGSVFFEIELGEGGTAPEEDRTATAVP